MFIKTSTEKSIFSHFLYKIFYAKQFQLRKGNTKILICDGHGPKTKLTCKHMIHCKFCFFFDFIDYITNSVPKFDNISTASSTGCISFSNIFTKHPDWETGCRLQENFCCWEKWLIWCIINLLAVKIRNDGLKWPFVVSALFAKCMHCSVNRSKDLHNYSLN